MSTIGQKNQMMVNGPRANHVENQLILRFLNHNRKWGKIDLKLEVK